MSIVVHRPHSRSARDAAFLGHPLPSEGALCVPTGRQVFSLAPPSFLSQRARAPRIPRRRAPPKPLQPPRSQSAPPSPITRLLEPPDPFPKAPRNSFASAKRPAPPVT